MHGYHGKARCNARYDVTLLSDGHATADMGNLTFEQIIAHHNAVLDGFDAGAHAVTLRPSAEVTF